MYMLLHVHVLSVLIQCFSGLAPRHPHVIMLLSLLGIFGEKHSSYTKEGFILPVDMVQTALNIE